MRKLHNYWMNGYAQDEWKPISNVTVNLGLRYDTQYHSFNNQLDFTGREVLKQLVDPTSRHDNNNFGPRVGVAWDVTNDTRTLVRAAYGRFYQYLPQGSLRNELGTLLQNSISITNPSYPDPYGGLSQQAFVTVSARPNVNILDDNIQNMTGDTATAGVSRQLMRNLAIHVDGVYTNLRQFARTQNINQPRPAFDFTTLDAATAAKIAAFSTAQLNAARPMANWGNIVQLTSNGWSHYRALYVRLDKRMANRYMYLVSYTRDWTTNSVDNVSDFYHPDLDTGPSGRKHTLVASGGRERLRAAAVRSHIRRGLDHSYGAAVQRALGRRFHRRRHDRFRPGDVAQSGRARQRGHRVRAAEGQRVAGGAQPRADSGEPAAEQRLQPVRHPVEPRAATGRRAQRRSGRTGDQPLRTRQPDRRHRRHLHQHCALELAR
ncbi:MAG: hypothetical protein DMF88_11630 [Acidobacteria bacterium]|nr:MAG: hypothetical protein DMF88_11630 [Acidobacteriota bacterium]